MLRALLLHSTVWCQSSRPGAALLHALNQQTGWPSPQGHRNFNSNSIHEHAAAAAAALQQPAECSANATTLALGDAAANGAASSSSSLLGSLTSISRSSSLDVAGGGGVSISQLFDAGSMGSFAAQPLEPLLQLLNPVVLSCSIWETVHSATGLPWWASIPLTTIALRSALLPLTIKAKSAGLNFVLAQQATQTATNLLDHWKQQQPQQAALSSGADSSTSGSSSSSGGLSQHALGLGRSEELKRPSRWRLTRMYYRYYRNQHGTTSLWWWTANIAVQLNVFLAMSLALRQMAATQWPGFTDQGLWLIQDLTHASIVWGSPQWWVGAYAPYSFAGFLLPAGLIWMYRKTTQESPLVKRNAVISLGMDLFMLPYLLVIVGGVPQATLVYWLTNSAFFMGLQHALGQPAIAHRLGLPNVMLPHPQHDKAARERAELEAMRAQQLVCGSEDVGFLRYLAASYVSRGLHQQALQCLQRLTMLSPGDADAFRALGNSAAEEQHWIQSARAFERAAELHAVAVDAREQVECLLLAAKQWLNATAEARAMQQRASQKAQLHTSSNQQQLQAVWSGSAAVGDAGGSEASSSDDGAQSVQPGQQQEYIHKALELLQQAIHYQTDGSADAYYLLSMAQAADGKWEPAYEAAGTFWSRSLALAENDQTARINAAARLLPVLNNLCKQRCRQRDYSALVTVGQLAVEVAKCGWDRQTEEQLRDTLAAAALAAKQQGKAILGQQIAELQQQLPCSVVRSSRKYA